jgi:hypothetical protein
MVRVFYIQCCDVVRVATNYPQVERAKFGYSQKKTRTPVDSFLESCQVLVISKNTFAKHGDFHVFLRTMWRTKRDRKRILWQREKIWKSVRQMQNLAQNNLAEQDTEKLPPEVLRGIPGSRGYLTSVAKRDSFLYFKRSLDSSHILLCHNTPFTLFPTAAAGPTTVKVQVSSSFSHVSVVFMTLAWLRKQIPNTSPKRSEWIRSQQNTMHAGMDLNTSRK